MTVRFVEAAIVRLHSVAVLRTSEQILLPVYFGRCAFILRVEDILALVDLAWLVTAIFLGIVKVVVL